MSLLCVWFAIVLRSLCVGFCKAFAYCAIAYSFNTPFQVCAGHTLLASRVRPRRPTTHTHAREPQLCVTSGCVSLLALTSPPCIAPTLRSSDLKAVTDLWQDFGIYFASFLLGTLCWTYFTHWMTVAQRTSNLGRIH